ncbi:MAG: hypothetical protein ACJAZ9_002102 [Neolewinella sp.]|jgi:hypothetical protein
MKGFPLLILLFISTFAVAQEEVPILDYAVSDKGTPLVTVASEPGFYYVLFGPQDRARALVQGEVGQAVLTEALAARPASDYTVRRYPDAAPGDQDNDGRDDLSEFTNVPETSPFNPVIPIERNDGTASIYTSATFDSLAFTTTVSSNNNPLTDRKFVKLYILDNDEPDSMRVYFMNTNTHEAHVHFANAIGIPTQANGNSFFEDMRGILVYHPAVTAPSGETGVYTFQFQQFDQYPFEIIEQTFELLGATLPFLENNLAYLPLHRRALDIYNANRPAFDNSRIPIFLEGDLYEGIDYLALNQTEGFGRLRLMEPGERPNSRDIVVYQTIPNDLPRVGGIITTVIQTPLSHVNLRALQDNVPNAFIRGALDDPDFLDLIGQNVYYRADADSYTIRAASPQEIDDWYDALRPDSTQVPHRDLTVTLIFPLDDISFEQAPAFGAKTANLSTMRDFGFPLHTIPDGFGIPLYFYDEYMKHNGFYEQAQALLDNPAFLSDFELQEALLNDLRDDIEDGDVPEWMFNAFTEMQNGFPEGTNIRCRSSTNNEDLPRFSGAGLYDSKTHKTTEGHISKTIKEVFASLWTFRAFSEREFFRIDHLQVGMGVLCHPNFKEEVANGVGVTIDPVYDTEGTYYVNTQVGEDLVTNPEGFSLPEEILIDIDGFGPTGYEILRRSNLAPPGEQVLTIEYLDSLRDYMEVIHAEFGRLYNAADNSDFGMDIEYKIDSSAALVIKQARPWIGYLGEIDTGTDAPHSHQLSMRVFPNPVSANSRLELTLNQPAHITLVLFDMVGRPVARIAEQTYGFGVHFPELHFESLPAGAYVLRARVVSRERMEFSAVKIVR